MVTEKHFGCHYLWGLMLLAVFQVGCVDRGVVQVMRDYHFTPISPPQTHWQVGSVIQIDRRFPSAPTLFNSPSDSVVGPIIIRHNAPDVSRNHNEKLELSGGVSLPAKVQAQLALQHATQYSVVAGGNFIVVVPLDPYAKSVYPTLVPNPLPEHWINALDNDGLYYINEMWFAQSLEYKFYDSNGVQLKVSAPTAAAVDWSASADFSWSDDGSLVYHGADPICLGYKSRAIARTGADGHPTPQAAGKPTPAAVDAKVHK